MALAELEQILRSARFCFSFRDTFLLPTFLGFCLYLVSLAFCGPVKVTFPLNTFKAHSDKHCKRSLSAPHKIALQMCGWAWARAWRSGAWRFTREDMTTFRCSLSDGSDMNEYRDYEVCLYSHFSLSHIHRSLSSLWCSYCHFVWKLLPHMRHLYLSCLWTASMWLCRDPSHSKRRKQSEQSSMTWVEWVKLIELDSSIYLAHTPHDAPLGICNFWV